MCRILIQRNQQMKMVWHNNMMINMSKRESRFHTSDLPLHAIAISGKCMANQAAFIHLLY